MSMECDERYTIAWSWSEGYFTISINALDGKLMLFFFIYYFILFEWNTLPGLMDVRWSG